MRVGHFGFDAPKLSQVAACFRFLRAKCWTKAVGFSKRCSCRFVVELTRLREVRLFTFEVLNFKQSRRPFTRGGRKNRRVSQSETILIEKASKSPDYCVSPFQNRVLPS